jgi:hypothetical protein
MQKNSSSGSRPHLWKRWIPPIVCVGAGGTTLLVWFEEVAVFVTEAIGVILLPILAGVIYLFNIFLFKSALPDVDDKIK